VQLAPGEEPASRSAIIYHQSLCVYCILSRLEELSDRSSFNFREKCLLHMPCCVLYHSQNFLDLLSMEPIRPVGRQLVFHSIRPVSMEEVIATLPRLES
jgi:hypothetical protein